MEDIFSTLRINSNIPAIHTHRQYAVNNNKLSTATKKLSSGIRTGNAADDAAGLAISEKMRAQVNQAPQNLLSLLR